MTFDQTVKTHWDRLKLHSDDYPTQQATNNTQRQCKTLEMIEKKVIEANTLFSARTELKKKLRNFCCAMKQKTSTVPS